MADEDLELEQQGDADDEEKPATSSGGSKKMIIAAVVVVVLAASGFLLMRVMQPAPTAQAAEDGEEGSGEPVPSGGTLLETGSVLQLETLLVNLADEDANRFVRARVELVFGTVDEMERVKESSFAMAKVQDVALSLLTTKQSSELADLPGRAQFREELAAQIEEELGGLKVIDVLLTDFIIQ